MVRDTGFEPVTSCVWSKRSTAELIAQLFNHKLFAIKIAL